MRYDFYTLDVFTDRVFGGNPLGVFPDAQGMDDATMQRVAREMNLSETVFLSPAETPEGIRRVRIFTPATEVPFAGHPTVGTAIFLVATGAIDLGDDGGTLVLEENVGPVPVRVDMRGGRPTSATFTTAIPPEHRPVPWDASDIARMIGVSPDQVGSGRFQPEMVSCGLPYIVIPVDSLAAVRGSRLDTAAWESLTRGSWSRMAYVVTFEAEEEDVDLHVRMYAPAAGVPEDPATGSAAAVLAAYLGRHAPVGTHRWTVEQGLEMGRPSTLHIEADVGEAGVGAVRVGGSAVMVSRGSMDVPGTR